MNTKTIAEVMDSITKKLTAKYPQIKEVLENAQKGDVSEQEALSMMMKMTAENPEIASVVASLFMEETEKTSEIEGEEETIYVASPAPSPISVVEKAQPITLEALSQIWEDRSAEGKVSRFNPLYESALIERLQFDGDAPELRTGPLVEGTPAVPVETTARSGVALGMQLKTASSEIEEEIQKLTDTHRREIQDQYNDPNMAAITKTHNTYTGLTSKELPQPKGYEAGKLPEKREVGNPTGSELSSLTAKERREMMWGFISTTQGRRSVIEIMKEIITERLSINGIEVVTQEKLSEGQVLASGHWTFTISGMSDIQDRFSFIETASYALAFQLKKNLEYKLGDEEIPEGMILDVSAVNAYSLREVGWGARLTKKR